MQLLVKLPLWDFFFFGGGEVYLCLYAHICVSARLLVSLGFTSITWPPPFTSKEGGGEGGGREGRGREVRVLLNGRMGEGEGREGYFCVMKISQNLTCTASSNLQAICKWSHKCIQAAAHTPTQSQTKAQQLDRTVGGCACPLMPAHECLPLLKIKHHHKKGFPSKV